MSRPARRPSATSCASATRRRAFWKAPYIPIDFAANAASLGAVAYARHVGGRASRGAASGPSAETRTVVIHVPIQKDARVPGFDTWWDVPVAEVSSVPTVRAAHETYAEKEKSERFFY